MDKAVYKIVCFGDSTTDDTFTSEEYSIEYSFLKPYSKWLQEKLSNSMGKNVEIINSGVSGDTTEDAKRRFQKDVLKHSPDIVIIQFGANDQCIRQDLGLEEPVVSLDTYAYNLLYFINKIKKIQAKPILMTPGMLLWNDGFKKKYFRLPYQLNKKHGLNGNIKHYVQKVRDIATIETVDLIDIFEKEMDYDLKSSNSLYNMLPDGIHPNNKGHQYIANIILEHLTNLE